MGSTDEGRDATRPASHDSPHFATLRCVLHVIASHALIRRYALCPYWPLLNSALHTCTLHQCVEDSPVMILFRFCRCRSGWVCCFVLRFCRHYGDRLACLLTQSAQN